MVDVNLADFYLQLHSRALTEPETEEDVKNILSCIRTQHGIFDKEDNTQLQKTASMFQKKMNLILKSSRQVLAQFTKAISSQLYDDPFRFFFELIQNADDANYSRCKGMPTMTFTVLPDELIVDTNEDGFCLENVISICNTGQSSKKSDEASTGEKGFGFKAVFGVADQVHVQSGVWSFRFDHQRHEEGLGMITPNWEEPRKLPDGIKTRFRLRYSMAEADSLETRTSIWQKLEAQHPSLLFGLHKLTKISILFKLPGREHHTVSFARYDSSDSKTTHIISTIGDKIANHFYRTFFSTVENMPKQPERSRPWSNIKIGLPVTAVPDGSPQVDANGEFVFACLPVVQLTSLPFLIDADFILPGSRQSVIDNSWNRKLRDEIATLFFSAVSGIVQEKSDLSYQWLAYIPQTMIGFWQPLQTRIQSFLQGNELFFSRAGTRHKASGLRILSSQFMHDKEPLLPDSSRPWRFMSARYSTSSHIAILKTLGITIVTYSEALDLLSYDLSHDSLYTQQHALSDRWHTSLLEFIERALTNNHRERVFQLPILPVRVHQKLEWRRPGPGVYWPVAVEDGSGPEKIKIEIPGALDLVVLHPDVADDPNRSQVYRSLGVVKCPIQTLGAAIEKAMAIPGSKKFIDLAKYFELLFWFSDKYSLSAQQNLSACTSDGTYAKSNALFFRSERQYHAQSLVCLSQHQEYKQYFLRDIYQASPVSKRLFAGRTWEQWLSDVAGVRWYPPLTNPQDRSKLHWMIETVREKNPAAFLPMLQNYWESEYRNPCRFNSKIKQSLEECQVWCQNSKFEDLSKTWFPSRPIVEAARYYGVQSKLPILTLPHSDDDQIISEWPSLTELGVRSSLGLLFYEESLLLLAVGGEVPEIGVTKMGWLYKNMGDRVTLEDQKQLKDDFEINALIWDSVGSNWRRLSECVWESSIPLRRKFVLTSTYDEAGISGLFRVHLNVGDVTTDCLIEELLFMKENPQSFGTDETLLERASSIYVLLNDMTEYSEDKKSLRAAFKDKSLIYSSNDNTWLKPSGCIWHADYKTGRHVPIAAMYPALQEFYVTTLGVSTVTAAFMMKQLATAAAKSNKIAEEIKKLMFRASGLLTEDIDIRQFDKSIESLQQTTFLPCRTSPGQSKFCSIDGNFFIVDNDVYAEKFQDKLMLLDFTYTELNSVHKLFCLLELDHRYLSKFVGRETSAETSTRDDVLSGQFQNCAYPISCCAISHQSLAFRNKNEQMYNDLANALIHTSPNLSTKLVVEVDGRKVKVESARASLILEHNETGLKITLPLAKTERKQSMRSQLPGSLAKLLNIDDPGAEKQLSRIINEFDSGTDEILHGEEISRVSWLTATSRPAPPLESEVETPPQSLVAVVDPFTVQGEAAEVPIYQSGPHIGIRQFGAAIHAVHGLHLDRQTGIVQPPPPYRALPETLNHEVDAPEYRKVLEHVSKQAKSIRGNHSNPTPDDITRYFASLTLDSESFDPEDYPSLFGADLWLSKFRIGAAGELFAYEALRVLTSNSLSLEHWQSGIRHLVQAHDQYSHVRKWNGREVADIMYLDQNNQLGRLLKTQTIGDTFANWRPDWLTDLTDDANQDPIEWLFEVKTTVGTCETEFFMGQGQYNLMRSVSADKREHTNLDFNAPPVQPGAPPTPPRERRRLTRVFCIIRVYNLLSEQVGVRFYIDPWRLRESSLEFGTTEKWKVTPIDA